MIKLYDRGVFLVNGRQIIPDDASAQAQLQQSVGRSVSREDAERGTIAHSIISEHNYGDEKKLRIKFDSLTSHDITSVGIILTARASGLERFPLPLVMTNCHNSLCAVGGTINEDDHMFALSAAKKYGGVYVPPNLGVIHTYNREMMAGCGRMILGSDSHTRYGALGTMAVGEGGGELVKQLLGKTYDLQCPEVVAIYLTGKPHESVGPHDVALSIIAAVFQSGYVKNKVMEFVGDGVANLPVEYRNGIDVMTTETTCWSSIWETDGAVSDYLTIHGRPDGYSKLAPKEVAYYDGMVHVDLSAIEPSIALPFHPSNVYTIREFKAGADDILAQVEQDAVNVFDSPNLNFNLRSKLRGDEFYVQQGIICGCAGGTFDNLMATADILDGKSTGNGSFTLSVYPGSQPIYLELVKNGAVGRMMSAGVLLRSAFCGPCFGAGDTPANGGFSIRHSTRNFPNREGSKPREGQISSVALMDARSIAATAINGGRLTSAADIDVRYSVPKFYFDRSIYEKRVYDGVGKADPAAELAFGPNIKEWPQIPRLEDALLMKIVAYITDPVTTTDELIPSGETSSFRSNPLRLAEFTLSRKDPEYVGRAKAVKAIEDARESGGSPEDDTELSVVFKKIRSIDEFATLDSRSVEIGSAIYANKPGDGSAREQAASCQRTLGGSANLAREYATKRYRSNLINWGMLPLLVSDETVFKLGDYLFLPEVKRAIEERSEIIRGFAVGETVREIQLKLGDLTDEERDILTAGCLINYYRS